MTVRRYLVIFSAVILGFTSCNKGRKLPDPVNVHFIDQANCFISPSGDFGPFDPNDPFEGTHSSNYVCYMDSIEIKKEFDEDLTYYLKKNNIIFTSDTATYEVKINYIVMDEDLDRQSYIDSCSFMNTTSYVYYSSLEFRVKASLYKNGVLIESWERKSCASEDVRSKTDSCNKPKVRSILRGSSSLISHVAKELRARISKKIYELEGY